MNGRQPNALARALRHWLADYLPRLRGLSTHTVHSYRDAFTLLLRFVATYCHRRIERLDLDDLDADAISAFLLHLDDQRGNAASTRNVRLAAIHAFFRYLATRDPARLEQCQQVLGVPFRRAPSRPVEYLERAEIEAVLAAIDCSTRDGRRDYTLLATMFNTGARVTELLGIAPRDLQLTGPFHVRLRGKGNKERICPLWPQTAKLLESLLRERGTDPASGEPLFRNHRGEPLTRFGVRYLLAKYCQAASATLPTLRGKRLHPHSMRHSTAVHLLKSGVDLVTISHWLGHASINTTNRYASVDLDMKREAINRIAPAEDKDLAVWHRDSSILDWLESL